MSEMLAGKSAFKKPTQNRTTVHNKQSVSELYGTLGRAGRYWRTRCFCPNLRYQAAEYLLKPGGVVYDLCCGNGENFPYLYAAVGPRGRIYASDVAENMVLDAKRRYQHYGFGNITVECSDASVYMPPEPLDGVMMSLCYNVLPHRLQVVRKAWEMLKKGGRLVIVDAKVPEVFQFLQPIIEPMILGLVGANPRIKAWEEIPKELGRVGILKRRMFDTHYIYCAIK